MTHRQKLKISQFLKSNRWRLPLKLLFKFTSGDCRHDVNWSRWRFSFPKLPVVCLIEHYAEGSGDTSITQSRLAFFIYYMNVKRLDYVAARFMLLSQQHRLDIELAGVKNLWKIEALFPPHNFSLNKDKKTILASDNSFEIDSISCSETIHYLRGNLSLFWVHNLPNEALMF